LGPLYRFGPLGPRHCRGCRWLVTPLPTFANQKKRRPTKTQNKHKKKQKPGFVAFHDIRSGNRAPKSKIESRAHYASEPARGGPTCNQCTQILGTNLPSTQDRGQTDRLTLATRAALDSAAAVSLGHATPHASPR